MEQKFYSKDIGFVEKEINATRASVSNEILEIKSDLLSVYLMNLVLYNKMEEKERMGSPVTEMLIKTSILLEKVCSMEKKAEMTIEAASRSGNVETSKPAVNEEEGSKRVISEEMMRNKCVVRKRKVEDRNPRLKRRNKAKKLAEKMEIKHDGNIDIKKTTANKFS